MLVTCIQIFFARILDVSLGTVRTVFTVKGKIIEPFILAFFEVIIWFIVAKEALNTAGNTLIIAISYAAGYATGTMIGSFLSNRFIRGVVGMEVVLIKENADLVKELRDAGHGVSVVGLKNTYDKNKKELLLITLKSNNVRGVTELIKKYDDKAFIVVNETKYVKNGIIK